MSTLELIACEYTTDVMAERMALLDLGAEDFDSEATWEEIIADTMNRMMDEIENILA